MAKSSTDQPSPATPDHNSGGGSAAVPSAGAASAQATTAAKAGMYRHDLDGLRGIAIALVVIFHIWMGRVSGGVDVFLVLSGFFFTGMLLRRGDRGTVGIVHTVRRTLRRLLPAMVVVLAAVVVATVALLPHTRWSDLAGQTLASLFYYQNWYLALSWSDYLAADPSVSPLQHLWSMSVQGQLYLTLLLSIALVAWLCRLFGRGQRMRLMVAGVFAVAVVASFWYAAHGVSTQQGWNYYDTFARAWEPLTGALLAIAAPLVKLPRLIREVCAWAGIAAIVACGWLVNGSAVFPGPAALLPVLATVALILSGAGLTTDRQPRLNRLLATGPMVRLGSYAYALYLWHWPILIFYLGERHERNAGPIAGALIVLASLGLAYATNRFVEEPLRLRSQPATAGTPAAPGATAAAAAQSATAPVSAATPGSRARRLTGVAVATVGLLLVGSTLAWQWSNSAKAHAVGQLDPAKYPGAEALTHGALVPRAVMRPTIDEAPADVPYPTRDSCISDFDTRAVVTCAYGVEHAQRTLAVVGNSHAEHWLPALQILAEQHRFKIVVYLKMGCPLTVAEEPMYKGQRNPDCRDWSREVIDRLAEEKPDWVFTTGTRPADNGGDETPQDYLDVWSELSRNGLHVVAIRDTPWLRRNGIRYRAIDCLASGGDRISCGMKRPDALSASNPAQAPAAAFSQVHTIDLNDAICRPDVCAVVEGNILVYHDEHHLTASYARSLAPELDRQLQPLLGWW
ncbi:acyltransferase [Nocardia sp. 2]|uniref:Acyltransferase n=2 Tax=Nocardia acididurans TaxID=2802282 RepID=A0ABS1MFU2_9NOCA|nr:acyltransferase [Nocardia acididurans]